MAHGVPTMDTRKSNRFFCVRITFFFFAVIWYTREPAGNETFSAPVFVRTRCSKDMSIPQLRVLTYLCPTIPVELFQGILEVLEEQTGYQTTLQYEWRSDGHSKKRLDPFENNLIDLGEFILKNTKCEVLLKGSDRSESVLVVTRKRPQTSRIVLE